jgi:hypothetical protein
VRGSPLGKGSKLNLIDGAVAVEILKRRKTETRPMRRSRSACSVQEGARSGRTPHALQTRTMMRNSRSSAFWYTEKKSSGKKLLSSARSAALSEYSSQLDFVRTVYTCEAARPRQAPVATRRHTQDANIVRPRLPAARAEQHDLAEALACGTRASKQTREEARAVRRFPPGREAAEEIRAITESSSQQTSPLSHRAEPGPDQM